MCIHSETRTWHDNNIHSIRFLLYLNDIWSNHARLVPLKDKKGFTIIYAFQEVLNESKRRRATFEGHKPNKAWVFKDSEFCDRPITTWLQVVIVAERLIRTLKSKI